LPHQKALLYSGKLSARKGVDILVESIRKLPAPVRKELVLVFLGDGDLRQELEQKAAQEPGVDVRFLGFQNQSRLSAYYHAADLLILPSLHSETWGLVVNEAMHHGIATVVSQAVGCGPDLVEPGVTGEVCATGDSASLAEAIERALRWCTTQEARVRCRARVDGYTVHEAAKGIAQAYGRAVEAGRTSVLGQLSQG
jgi:glycosyltransferase involved in cell wall biosynthesis